MKNYCYTLLHRYFSYINERVSCRNLYSLIPYCTKFKIHKPNTLFINTQVCNVKWRVMHGNDTNLLQDDSSSAKGRWGNGIWEGTQGASNICVMFSFIAF